MVQAMEKEKENWIVKKKERKVDGEKKKAACSILYYNRQLIVDVSDVVNPFYSIQFSPQDKA